MQNCTCLHCSTSFCVWCAVMNKKSRSAEIFNNFCHTLGCLDWHKWFEIVFRKYVLRKCFVCFFFGKMQTQVQTSTPGVENFLNTVSKHISKTHFQNTVSEHTRNPPRGWKSRFCAHGLTLSSSSLARGLARVFADCNSNYLWD